MLSNLNRPVRIAVIGAGYAAEVAHLPHLTRLRLAQVCALVDVDLSRARALANRFEIARVAADYRDVINDRAIDLVDICTPPSTHALIACEALRLGKAVIVEKPLTKTVGEAIEVARALRESSAPLCVVLNLRYMPAAWKALQLVNDGSLGRIHHVSAFSHTRRPDNRGHPDKFEVLYDFVPHIVDLVVWVTCSIPRRVLCARSRHQFPNACILLVEMELPDGGTYTMSLDASWNVATTQRVVRFFGTNLDLTVDLQNQAVYTTKGYNTPIQDAVIWAKMATGFARRVLGGPTSLKYGAMVYHRDLLGDFLRRFVAGEHPIVPFVDALAHVAVVDAAVRSLGEGVPIEVAWDALLMGL